MEDLASFKNIRTRTGGMCNSGDIKMGVCLETLEIEKKYLAGYRYWDG